MSSDTLGYLWNLLDTCSAKGSSDRLRQRYRLCLCLCWEVQPLASEKSQPTVAQQDPAPFEAAVSSVPKSHGVPSTIKHLPNRSFTTEERFIEDGLSLGARQNSMPAMKVFGFLNGGWRETDIQFHRVGFVILTLSVLCFLTQLVGCSSVL